MPRSPPPNPTTHPRCPPWRGAVHFFWYASTSTRVAPLFTGVVVAALSTDGFAHLRTWLVSGVWRRPDGSATFSSVQRNVTVWALNAVVLGVAFVNGWWKDLTHQDDEASPALHHELMYVLCRPGGALSALAYGWVVFSSMHDIPWGAHRIDAAVLSPRDPTAAAPAGAAPPSGAGGSEGARRGGCRASLRRLITALVPQVSMGGGWRGGAVSCDPPPHPVGSLSDAPHTIASASVRGREGRRSGEGAPRTATPGATRMLGGLIVCHALHNGSGAPTAHSNAPVPLTQHPPPVTRRALSDAPHTIASASVRRRGKGGRAALCPAAVGATRMLGGLAACHALHNGSGAPTAHSNAPMPLTQHPPPVTRRAL
jgi:hypothetical protein